MDRENKSVNNRIEAPRETRQRAKDGIKFFSGKPLPDQEAIVFQYQTITVENLRDAKDKERRVWRPEETLEAAKPFFGEGRVHIIGSPNAGKGTILYGLSEICHRMGWGYAFIDGHHQETPAETAVEAIREAKRKNIPIFFDSFDYLFAGSRSGVRTITTAQRNSRTSPILDALDNANTPIAITSHDEEWAKSFIDITFRERFRKQLDKYPVYEIPLNLQSKESIVRFLIDQGIGVDGAEFLVEIEKNPAVLNVLVHHFTDHRDMQKVFEAITHFPVLKELTRENREKFLKSIEGAKQNSQEAIINLAQIIREAEYKCIFSTILRKLK